jgi:hypothetical protein
MKYLDLKVAMSKISSKAPWLLLLVVLFMAAAVPVYRLRNVEKAPAGGYVITSTIDGTASWTLSGNGEINVNPIPINYIPGVTGNISNLNQVVTDPTGKAWIIDQNGDAVRTSSTTTGSGPPPEADEIFYDDSDSGIGEDVATALDSLSRRVLVSGGDADLSFDSDRPVLRVPEIGDVIGGSTLTDVLAWQYFAPPTITCSISAPSVFEVGTVNNVTVSGVTSNPGNATLSNGESVASGISLFSFGAAETYTSTLSYTPGASGFNNLIYTASASQDWTGGGESGTATSPSRTFRAVYPVLYGVSDTDLTGGGTTIYTTLNKLVQVEGNKTVTLDGSGFIYYAVPTEWTDTSLSSIIDANGFNVTSSFTATTTVLVTSTGLANNWSQNYVIYKLNNLTTISNANYTFNR